MKDSVRDTHVSRDRIRNSVRLALWARAAGRCTICDRQLLGDAPTFLHSVTVAELAHNVGATDGDTSPRSDAGTADMDRESEENLLLVCRAGDRGGGVLGEEMLLHLPESDEHLLQALDLAQDDDRVLSVVLEVAGQRAQALSTA